jgi:dTDP-4-dehydrorhamnose 3,5-epimerase
MLVKPTGIPDVLVIEPRVFSDERGFFQESFNEQAFDAAVGKRVQFVQDNHSFSRRGVLRGLHYQLPPFSQGKLVRVVAGEVFDVAVDLRKGSPSFGRWVGERLSGSNHKQLWIPPGFAHGFFTLSESAHFLYKTTAYFFPESERCIRWDDPSINISWPIHGELLISAKDALGASLEVAESAV